jgi:hypothetical protein
MFQYEHHIIRTRAGAASVILLKSWRRSSGLKWERIKGTVNKIHAEFFKARERRKKETKKERKKERRNKRTINEIGKERKKKTECKEI